MSLMTTFNGEKWRVITPILLSLVTVAVTGGLWILSDIRDTVKDVSQKLYAHQTNHDLHTPRAELVELRRDFLDQRKELKADIDRILILLEKRK